MAESQTVSIIAELEDRMSAEFEKIAKKVDGLTKSSKKADKSVDDLGDEAKKTGDKLGKMGAKGKKAGSDIAAGAAKGKASMGGLGAALGKVGPQIVAAFSVGALIGFAKFLDESLTKLANMEKAAGRLANSASGGSLLDRERFGKTFAIQSEKTEQSFGLERGSLVDDFGSAFRRAIEEGKIDITGTDEEVGGEVRDMLQQLIAIRDMGGDAGSVTEAAIAASNVTGNSVQQELEELIALAQKAGKPVNDVAAGVSRLIEATAGAAESDDVFGVVAAGLRSSEKGARTIQMAIEQVMMKVARSEEIKNALDAGTISEKDAAKQTSALGLTGDFIADVAAEMERSGKVSSDVVENFEKEARQFSEFKGSDAEKGAADKILVASERLRTAGESLGDAADDLADAAGKMKEGGFSLWDLTPFAILAREVQLVKEFVGQRTERSEARTETAAEIANGIAASITEAFEANRISQAEANQQLIDAIKLDSTDEDQDAILERARLRIEEGGKGPRR